MRYFICRQICFFEKEALQKRYPGLRDIVNTRYLSLQDYNIRYSVLLIFLYRNILMWEDMWETVEKTCERHVREDMWETCERRHVRDRNIFINFPVQTCERLERSRENSSEKLSQKRVPESALDSLDWGSRPFWSYCNLLVLLMPTLQVIMYSLCSHSFDIPGLILTVPSRTTHVDSISSILIILLLTSSRSNTTWWS
jgi:hypothetical protein